MPDPTGKFSQEEIDKIVAYLKSFGKEAPTCEICGTNHWGVNQHLISPVPFGTQLSSIAYPQFMIYCHTCRNTKYLGAMTVPGLIQQPPSPPVIPGMSMQEMAKNV